LKVLYIAELVGKAGIACCKKALAKTRLETGADFVIACADGATNGSGLGFTHAVYLKKLGVDVITLGECAFYKKDLTENINRLPYVLRPDNFVFGAPGCGSYVYKLPGGGKIGVAVLLGQSHFNKIHGENPFLRLEKILERLRSQTPFIIIDIHAEATAEKYTVFNLAAGKASAVIGSHTRIQTADEHIMDGTAVICCAGRTGSLNSVGGCESGPRIKEYLSGIPDWTRTAWETPQLQGVVVELDEDGRAVSIERLQIPVAGVIPPEDGR
jgi:metallophosphoesterase (TIGR00282 family)